jgi:hypothetical protein
MRPRPYVLDFLELTGHAAEGPVSSSYLTIVADARQRFAGSPYHEIFVFHEIDGMDYEADALIAKDLSHALILGREQRLYPPRP